MLKNWVLAAITICTLALDAKAAEFPPDVTSVRLIPGTVLRVSSLCPAGTTCVTNGTELEVAFTLGCVDVFGADDWRMNEGVLNIAMIGLTRRASETVRCVRANTKVIKLSLVNVYPPFTVQFAGNPDDDIEVTHY